MSEYNPNEALSNLHCVFVASSGGGKTQAMADKLRSVKGKKRVIFWDTHSSFIGFECKTLAELGRALLENKDKKDFRICYQGKGGEANFKLFMQMLWEIRDGDLLTYIVVDEVADCTESIGKDRSGFGQLLRGGRKFGFIVYSTAVSVAEVPNTVWRESKTKFIGQQDNASDLKRCADVLVSHGVDDVQKLKPLEFLVKTPDNKVIEKAIKYVKSPHKV